MTSAPSDPGPWHPPSDGVPPHDAAAPYPGVPYLTGPVALARRASVLADLLVAVLTGVVIAALGAPLGWLWAALAPRIPIVRVDGGFTYAESEPEQVVAADGWFMLIGAAAGILIAIAVWVLLRRWRGPFMALGLVLGSLGAAWLAWFAGRHVGLAEFERLRASATVGTRMLAPLGLRSTDFLAAHAWRPWLSGVMAVQALAAAFAYTCCAGWSRYASLRGPDPVPTYLPYHYADQASYPQGDPDADQPPQPDGQFGPGRTGSSDTASGTALT